MEMRLWFLVTTLLLILGEPLRAQIAPTRTPLVNLDFRRATLQTATPSGDQVAAAEALRKSIPSLKLEFEPVTGSPKQILSTEGFLTGPDGKGDAIASASLAAVSIDDSNRVTKAFLNDHRQLFGFGSEALDQARIARDDLTAHNGMRTVVWEQLLDGIAVFGGTFISHTTRKGELISLSSQFHPSPVQAASKNGTDRASLIAQPPISATKAVVLAVQNIGEELDAAVLTPVGGGESGPEQHQKFKAPGLKGDTDVKLIWLPIDQDAMRLCWDITLMSRKRGEMFREIVDAQTGQLWVRRCLTSYLSDASYRVYTSDSPSPFSPGWQTPSNGQPPYVSRTLVTWPALDTNASPAGWIPDSTNETVGNNVDAHTDRNADNAADLPRPQGSPFRVFDFPMDLTTQDPTNYGQAAVVQLFYLANWYHDKMYPLGFTESAGNFQSTNFNRGGVGNDPVQADAQDGSGTDNANFSTPADGSSGRMQMYVFSTPVPRRDGDFDAEVVLHELTHGLSWRLVGGGQALGDIQSDGMGEGWSDFYSLALLSEAGDDVNAAYAEGGYVTYQLGGLTQNYYFGIRRYPYSTDLTKNPLTLKDIDPAQASSHPGVPVSPIIGSTANEVHNEGEVWCVTLREVRANLITKYGWAVGNQLMLQLVTDGMKLTVAHPNFLQARDGILQADLVDTGGANRNEIWAGFAKRGMGVSATSPASSTTTGIHEAFDIPDSLHINPLVGFSSSGGAGGPFSVTTADFTLTNVGLASLNWSLTTTSTWLSASSTSGTLPTGTTATVTFSLNSFASNLVAGFYTNTAWFTNVSSGVGQRFTFTLFVLGAPVFTIQPSNTTVFGGANVTFSPSVLGLAPLSYQWQLYNTNLPNATNLSLTLNSVTTNQSGPYALIASNSLGVTPSSNALLTVIGPAANDICANAILITGTTYANSQTTSNATSNGDPIPSCVGSFGNGVWYVYTTPTNGTLVVDTVGSGFDTVLGMYTGTCGALGQTGCDDDSGGNLTSSINLSATANTTYYILAGGYAGARGNLVLHLAFTSASTFTNDTCAGATLVTSTNFTTTESTVSATSTGDPAPTCVTSLGKGVWFTYTPPANGTSVVDTIGSTFDTALGAYSGSCGALTQVGCDDDGGGSLKSKITLPVSGGVTYYFLAGGFSGASGTLVFHLAFTNSGSAPSISVQPTNQLVGVGSSASFSVTASGTAPLSYFWRRNGQPISGANSAGYTTNNVQMSDSGAQFSCLVSNALGVNLSSNAVLNVRTGMVLMAIGRATNGKAQFQISGQAGDVYRVLASSNLVNWNVVGSATNVAGTASFTDPGSSNLTRRFYRCVMP